MSTSLLVHFLPSLVAQADLAGGAVVVIDVLRASTTIVHALAAGAERVIPCGEIEEARRIASAVPAGEVVLGGERGGLPIPGFQLGNSPREYTPQSVGGRTVVFTTTNGTRALSHAKLAGEVLVGAPVNAAAIVGRLADRERIHLLGAGTEGKVSREDVLTAGLLAARLIEANSDVTLDNDEARIARALWQEAARHHAAEPLVETWLAEELADSAGGRNLAAIGLADDIVDAARLDRFDLMPRLDVACWKIERAGPRAR